MIRVGIITVSDKGSAGERKDISGETIKEMISSLGVVAYYNIIPDEVEEIKAELAKLADQDLADLVLTTGGTGFAERDVTPEATLAVIDKEAQGIAEFMRSMTFSITPMAALSRARAGIRRKTLIINLPGNPKAVKECLETIIPVLEHAVEILRGTISEHIQEKEENELKK